MDNLLEMPKEMLKDFKQIKSVITKSNKNLISKSNLLNCACKCDILKNVCERMFNRTHDDVYLRLIYEINQTIGKLPKIPEPYNDIKFENFINKYEEYLSYNNTLNC